MPRTVTPGASGRANRSLIAGLVVLGFVLRLAFGLGYWVGKPLMKDEQEYLLLAARVAAGQGFSYPPAPVAGPAPRHFERPPVFAFFLATILTATHDPMVGAAASNADILPPISSEVPVAIKVAQSLLGAIGILLMAALAARAAGPRAAAAAAAIAAVYPPLVWTCGYVLTEPLYSALALLTAWVLLRASDTAGQRQLWIAFGAGVLAGVALLTKEPMLFFLPLAALWLVVRRQTMAAFALAAGVMLVAVPWIGRNYAVHHRFVLTAAHGGVTLWTGNNPLARGEGDLAANPDMGRARVALENSHPGMSNQDLDAVYYHEVVQFIAGHPAAWLALDAKKLFYTFVPIGPSYWFAHSRLYYVASLLSYGLLMPVALLGLWRLGRRGDPSRLWALWLLAASTVVVCLIFFPQERFRIPVIDPTAVVCAAIAWAQRRVA